MNEPYLHLKVDKVYGGGICGSMYGGKILYASYLGVQHPDCMNLLLHLAP